MWDVREAFEIYEVNNNLVFRQRFWGTAKRKDIVFNQGWDIRQGVI